MAVQTFFPVIAAGNGGANTLYAATLGAAGTSGVNTVGRNALIQVVASGAIAIRFGTSTNLTTVGATDIYIPANTVQIFDLGYNNDSFDIYAFGANTIVSVHQISKI